MELSELTALLDNLGSWSPMDDGRASMYGKPCDSPTEWRSVMARAKKLTEASCPILVRTGAEIIDDPSLIGPNDFVIAVKDAYDALGVDTKSENDTKILSTSPGRFTWPKAGQKWGEHRSKRKPGFKLTLMLSSPQDEKPKAAEKKKAASLTMGQLV